MKQILLNLNILTARGSIDPNKLTDSWWHCTTEREQILKNIKEYTTFLSDSYGLKERIFCILNDIKQLPVCEHCLKNSVQLRGTKFNKTCSKYCAHQLALKKTTETNIQRFGKPYYTQTTEYKEKTKNTSLLKYGVEHHSKRECHKEIAKKTLEKYRHKLKDYWSDPIRIKKANEKRNNTLSESPDLKQQIQNKRTNSLYERYGVINTSQLRRLNFDNSIKEQLTKENLEILYKQHKLSLNAISDQIGVSPSFIAKLLREYDIEITDRNIISLPHQQIYDYLLTVYFEPIINNDRTQLDGKEIDIWLPDKNIGIELNGCYYHSTQFLYPKYHKEKTDLAISKGIRLFQFYDSEWSDKSDIVKSIISNSLDNNKKRIYGRKTKTIDIAQNQADIFYDLNHIQGKTKSKVHIGLLYKEELVSLMSFTTSRFNNNYEWELTRFCSSLNTQVIGGASKLLHHFINKYNPKSIISYADLRISLGNVYDKLGFVKIKSIPIDYKYLVGKELIRKNHFRHKYLKKLLKDYDPNLTELENTEKAGIFRVYDCGKLVYVWTKPTK